MRLETYLESTAPSRLRSVGVQSQTRLHINGSLIATAVGASEIKPTHQPPRFTGSATGRFHTLAQEIRSRLHRTSNPCSPSSLRQPFAWRSTSAQRQLPRIALATGENLDVCTAYVNGQDLHEHLPAQQINFKHGQSNNDAA